MSSQLLQISYHYQNTPRNANNNQQISYDNYVSKVTPKKLPSLDASSASKYQSMDSTSNYTYVYSGKSSSPYNSDSESPIKKEATPSVKLPSFKSLLQSIHTPNAQEKNQAATTLSFDTPLMNSLHLENANFRALPATTSAHSSPLINDNSTFFGNYNYSKVQFEDPYSYEKSTPQQPQQSQLLAPATIRQEQQSPLQFQQERFAVFNPPQAQFTFQQPIQMQVQQKQMNGLQQLAQVIRNNEMLQLKSSEKRFRCKLCSRGFNTAGNLSRHKKVHTGEKKYKCQYPGCESKFARSDSCMQHYRTHANENGYTSRRFKKLKTDGSKDEEEEEEDQTKQEEDSPNKMKVNALMC